MFWLGIKAYVGYIPNNISPKELAFGDSFCSSQKTLDLKLTLYELDRESIVLLDFRSKYCNTTDSFGFDYVINFLTVVSVCF